MDEEETTLAAPRKVQRDGDRIVVSLPQEAVENSGLAVGEETMVAYKKDGPIVLVPWARDDVVEMFREDSEARSGADSTSDDEAGAPGDGA